MAVSKGRRGTMLDNCWAPAVEKALLFKQSSKKTT